MGQRRPPHQDRPEQLEALRNSYQHVYAINPLTVAATAIHTTSRGPNPMPTMPNCLPTWCTPTATPTEVSPATALKPTGRDRAIWELSDHHGAHGVAWA
jgi:hypothetical protein